MLTKITFSQSQVTTKSQVLTFDLCVFFIPMKSLGSRVGTCVRSERQFQNYKNISQISPRERERGQKLYDEYECPVSHSKYKIVETACYQGKMKPNEEAATTGAALFTTWCISTGVKTPAIRANRFTCGKPWTSKFWRNARKSRQLRRTSIGLELVVSTESFQWTWNELSTDSEGLLLPHVPENLYHHLPIALHL